MQRKRKVREIKLHLSSLSFEPYTEFKGKLTSRTILKNTFEYLREQRNQGKGHLIDKHENRDKQNLESFL